MPRQNETPEPAPGYRPCVGIFLLNRAREVFVGRRLDTPGDALADAAGRHRPG